MRRLARHVFTFATAVSLVLWVAVCALWVRSYWTADELRRTDGSYRIASVDGRFYVQPGAIPDDIGMSGWALLGFGRWTAPADATIWAIMFPHWFVALLAAPLPALALASMTRVRRRATRRRAGFCPACGYDLRASPQRCPECGAATPLLP